MRINKINITEEITQTKGIAEINLKRLGSVVALVGKNGSGKSRILELVEKEFINKINVQNILNKDFTELPKRISPFLKNIKTFERLLQLQNSLNEIKQLIAKNPDDIGFKSARREIDAAIEKEHQVLSKSNTKYGKRLNNLIESQGKILPDLADMYFRKINTQEIIQLKEIIEEKPNEELQTFEHLIDITSEVSSYNELQAIHRSALKYLIKLPHQLAFDRMDCMDDPKKYEKRIAHKRFMTLKILLDDFLHKDLTWERKTEDKTITEAGVKSMQVGTWKLNGRKFNYNEFSEGEKTLFAYALLFFLLEQNPDLRIKESIIFIDEPELHLHPDSELDLITGIRKAIGEKGQLWIATHSINILSNLNYEEIFMVKYGTITHPSQFTPGKSLSELINLEDRVHKLSEFLTSISDWAYSNFMTQCFSHPEVIESAKPNDPQVELFKQSISKSPNNKLNMLLDFGAGKGRLYEQLQSDEQFASKIKYYAVEPQKNLHHHLSNLGVNKIFSGYDDIPDNTFDYIVLCNVLHEVLLEDWVKNLNKLIKAIKEDGYLIIIEDRILPKGEKIGEIGYLVLDAPELKELFDLDSEPALITLDSNPRIMCALMLKSNLKPINKNNVIRAMTLLEENTLKKIKELRKKNTNEANKLGIGRKSAFYSQLYINSKLAQEFLNQNK